jgi:hypothetical protein
VDEVFWISHRRDLEDAPIAAANQTGDTTNITLIVANKNKNAMMLSDVITKAVGGDYLIESGDGGFELG